VRPNDQGQIVIAKRAAIWTGCWTSQIRWFGLPWKWHFLLLYDGRLPMT